MDFEGYFNDNHKNIMEIFNNFSRFSGDSIGFKKDINSFCNALIEITLDRNVSFQINKRKYLLAPIQAPDTKIVKEYVIVEEGNTFDLFYRLVSKDPSISLDERKRIFKEIQDRAFDRDPGARAALAMCQMLGVFMPKNETEAHFKLNDLGLHYDNKTACALLAQYYYFEVYKKLHDLSILDNVRKFLALSIKESPMARAFNARYNIINF